MLSAFLAAMARQTIPAVGDDNSEVSALRLELDESNQGLLALHTELCQQQEEVERARVAADRASRAKADFLANMSHEIRSPMTAVVGFTSLLRATELSPEQVEYAEALQAAAGICWASSTAS